METQLFDLFRSVIALAGGLAIGLGFGLLQAAAKRFNERRQASGKLKSGWAVMPGSMGRVALLLVVLALIQAVCPMFFTDGVEWWVSGGLVLGYGVQLFTELRTRRAMLRAA